MQKFVIQRISSKHALCYEQTSPLGVLLYTFGFSLSVLHYFSFAPKRLRQNAVSFCRSLFLHCGHFFTLPCLFVEKFADNGFHLRFVANHFEAHFLFLQALER